MSVNNTPHASPHRTPRRLTEAKAAVKTTEFIAYLATVAAVLLASTLVGETDDRPDPFLADKAWLYITLLTIGYLLSRGLAKSGSPDFYDHD